MLKQQKPVPRYLRVFMNVLAGLCIVQAVLLMVSFIMVWTERLPEPFLGEIRMVYLFAVTAYGSGTVSESRWYNTESQKKQRPFEFTILAWLGFYVFMTIRLLVDFNDVPFKLFGELSFVVAWVFAVFIASRAGKDFPDTWVRPT